MPAYDLNALGDNQFEEMTQSLLKDVIGAGTITFGAGTDGAREATFCGEAPYPSSVNRWSGNWIFQVKFHDALRVPADKARRLVVKELDEELDKVVNKYRHPCDNFILVTNVPLSSTALTGSHDVIAQKIAPKYAAEVTNIHVWGYDDVCRLLERHPRVRQSYLHLLTTGDLIARLMRGDVVTDIDETIRLFLASDLDGDRFASLDQAGEVGDESVPLTRIFIDLDVALREGDRPVAASANTTSVLDEAEWQSFVQGEATSAMRLMLSDEPRRLVLIGGPGQGKSTLGQFLAQIHRASLLGRLKELIGDESGLTPLVPRIPLRVILRDFAQWAGQTADGETKRDTSVELYLAEHIRRQASNDAPIAKSDVHDILRANPCLCIFDGLDEIVDPGLRAVVLGEIRAFLERTELGLHADIQVIGTSRPNGYLNEFDPATFTHVRLQTLSSEKARSYAERWMQARIGDPARRTRVKQAFVESADDPQVSLLLNTPLQVTIIMYVILVGGRPSRQRESLFGDYVDVIYRRERAKHRSIIRTEKDLLLGLHDYLGYIIHRRAGDPAHVIAALTSQEFNKEVRTFLRHRDPWKSGDALEEQVQLLVTEAQDRLVLLVELVPGQFGFELRSLQEYFAATHLVQTSSNSDQRFERFLAIARSGHWRNAALFFAGQVGRLFRGEAANLVLACRAIDSSPTDALLRRGCALGLDLAVDRAFGSNQPLQHQIVAEALAILESGPGNWDVREWSQRLKELPRDDIEHHAVPELEIRVGSLDAVHKVSAMTMLHAVQPSAELIPQVLESWLHEDDVDRRLTGLRLALTSGLPEAWVAEHATAAINSLPTREVAEILALRAGSRATYLGRCLTRVAVSDELADEVVLAMTGSGIILSANETLVKDLQTGNVPDVDSDIVGSGLFGLWMISAFSWQHLGAERAAPEARIDELKDFVRPVLPVDVDARMSRFERHRAIARLSWQIRTEACDVWVVETLVALIQGAEDSPTAATVAWQFGGARPPFQKLVLDLMRHAQVNWVDGPRFKQDCSIVAQYSGPEGLLRWAEVEDLLSNLELSKVDRVDVLLNDPPRLQQTSQVRSMERLLGLPCAEIGHLLLFADRRNALDDDLAETVLQRVPAVLDSPEPHRQADGLNAIVQLSSAMTERLAEKPGFRTVLERVAKLAPQSPDAMRILQILACALAAQDHPDFAQLRALLAVIGEGETTLWFAPFGTQAAAKAVLAVVQVVALEDQPVVLKGALSLMVLVEHHDLRLPLDDPIGHQLVELVASLLASGDPLVQAVAARALPVLPGALVSGIDAALDSLAPDMAAELESAWISALPDISNSMADDARAKVSQRVRDALHTSGFSARVRNALFVLLRRLADADPPEINSREVELGLPLPESAAEYTGASAV